MSELDEFFGPSKAHAAALEPRRAVPANEHERTPPHLSPQAIKRRGENWTKDYMMKLGGIYVKKRSDAPVVLPDGREYIPKGLDMYGSVQVPGSVFAWKVEVEVKTFSDSFALSALKEHQVGELYGCRQRGELAMLSLVEHDGGVVSRMWWILWPEDIGAEHFRFPLTRIPTFSWVVARLREKAAEDARYHAKSIRQVDLSMMDQFLVAKSGRQWQLSETHWLRTVLDIPVPQEKLL